MVIHVDSSYLYTIVVCRAIATLEKAKTDLDQKSIDLQQTRTKFVMIFTQIQIRIYRIVEAFYTGLQIAHSFPKHWHIDLSDDISSLKPFPLPCTLILYFFNLCISMIPSSSASH